MFLGLLRAVLSRRLLIVTVQGDSMRPALADQTLVACERVDNQQLRRGDVVVVRPPGPERYIVKRLAGLPGDDLSVLGCGSGTIPPGHGVILSDNSLRRGDSRDIGPILLSTIIARRVQVTCPRRKPRRP